MSRLANEGHDRKRKLRNQIIWCVGHDRTMNHEKRTQTLPRLLVSGETDAWIVLSRQKLDAMQRSRLDYRDQLAAHKVVVDGGRWVRTGLRVTTWPRYSDLPWIREREACRWEWAR